MKRNKIILIGTIGIFLFSLPAIVDAVTINAVSCSLSDVQAAINSAQSEDTVNVPAGECIWSSPLTITKSIALMGAGIGKTVITRGGGYIWSYYPSNYSLNAPFRLSGFSFDGNGSNIASYLGQLSAPAPPYTLQTKIRIDHNRFFNSAGVGGNAMYYRGGVFGVVDNNVFDNYWYPLRNVDTYYGPGWWDAWETEGFRFVLGTRYNIYFEDNIFNLGSSTYNIVSNSQYSGRYVFRYNTIAQAGEGQTLFDMHGSQEAGSRMYSSFGGEIYGNLIYNNNYDTNFCGHRGGKMTIFYNVFLNARSVTTKVWESDDDAIMPTTSPDPQHPNDGYYWRNIKGYTGATSILVVENEHIGDIPLVNRDYFTDVATSYGPAGMSSGTLANRPISGTYIGQGYWATDDTLSDLTNYVGKNPKMPISGNLYRWTASGWESFYAPYTYPHPLRTDCVSYPTLCDSVSEPPVDTTPPAAPTGVTVQ